MGTNEKSDVVIPEPEDPRFPLGRPIPKAPPTETAEWTQVEGRPQGIQIHRDGKTLRNLCDGSS